MEMRRVCAWCGEPLAAAGEPTSNSRAVTHGICPLCAGRLLGEMGTPLDQFLDSLGVPVLVVTENVQVIRANGATLALVGRDREEILGLLGGDVLECTNAGLPGGCGATASCSACAIRGSVAHTHATGEALARVPATLDGGPGGVESTALFISTEKVEDKILLRIETA